MEKTRPTPKRVSRLATKLLTVFYDNGLTYFPPYESWARRYSDEAWRSLPYSYVTELAHFSLHGILGKKPGEDLVKAVLNQIERWMIACGGHLTPVINRDGSRGWMPLCNLVCG